MKTQGRFLSVSLLIIACAAASACRADRPSQPVAVAAAVQLDEIKSSVGSDVAPKPQTSTDAIVITVMTSSPRAAQLDAKLVDLRDGRQAGLANRRIPSGSRKTTEIRFEPTPTWAAGRYMVEVSIDGKLVGQRDIDVVDASAMDAPPKA